MAINIDNSVRYIIKRDLKQLFPKEFTNRELIGKFFDYVMNNFFQKSYESYLNGFIGKKSVAYDKGDLYINESSAERQNYQLTPMITSKVNGEKTIVDYVNFINTLKNQGCLTNDQNRLLSNNYWSWCPPINVDMFLNYNFYYWIEEGVNVYEISTKTNAVNDIIGKTSFKCKYIDINGTENDLVFSSGMRIKLLNDENNEYNNKTFIIEGVGKSIQMIIDDEILFSSNSSPDYYVMERGAKDGNDWSLRNRWFHRSVISTMNNKNIYVLYDNDSKMTLYSTISSNDVNENSSLYLDSDCSQFYKKFGELANVVYTNQIIQNVYKQAKKPIICFNKDIQLYNYGTSYRGYIDLVVDMEKNQLQGSKITELDGVKLKDGMLILLKTNDDSEDNNKIFEITGISSLGFIVLQKSINGISTDGEPVEGEGVRVRNNRSKYANKYFYFKNGEWVDGQKKTTINQSPLFQLYDYQKVSLDNLLYYNQSTFKGSKLFDYLISDNNESIDNDLGKSIVSESYGNYIFNNILANEKFYYMNYDKMEEIIGYKYFKINGTEQYLNNWYYTNNKSQYIITEINVTDNKVYEEYVDSKGIKNNYTVYELEIEPDEINNKKTNYVYINGILKQQYQDYIIEDKKLKFLPNITLNANDNIYIKLLKEKIDSLPYGYYFDLPLTLTANVTNKDVGEIKYNECFDQMNSIIENQTDFQGQASSYNNYNNTQKDLSLGTEILQHSCPIYKTMLLNSKEYTNIRNVLSFVSNEYSKFKNKFRNIIYTMSINNEFNEIEDMTTEYIHNIVQKALDKINIGKEGLNAFYNNGVAEIFGNCYIPSTPAYLGLDSCYKPEIIIMDENPLKPEVLLCHDGSYTKLFNDYRDNALLYLENMIYESIPNKFKNNEIEFSKFDYIPGKFRNTEYSVEEYLTLLSSLFEKWCNENNINYSENDLYDRNDAFSWNWSSCKDIDGEQLRGSYKSIYTYYYDTIRPHTHPWEMLGFAQKPEWWENHYGKTPYTSANISMWKDIENGYITEGVNKGYHKQFERKGLIDKFLPVDENGNLLNPYQIGITNNEPLPVNARKSWVFGDMGRYEYAWLHTSEYRFAIQTLLYLMKPLQWVETNWDTLNNETIFKETTFEQKINSVYKQRVTPEYIVLHNEKINNTYIKQIGIQQWISDFLVHENIDISNYIGNVIRNVDVQLGYKCGRFYKKDSLKFISDNYGLIPNTDYSLNLYKTITSNHYNYSALVIQKVKSGYMIDGYDLENPYFNILVPEYNGKKSPIEINNKKFTYHNQWTQQIKKVKYKTIYQSVQDLYTDICGYGKYLELIEGWEFITLNDNGEIINFREKAKDFLIWSDLDLYNGAIILLNPGCYEIVIHHNSFIDKLGQYINGYWSISDTAYDPIYNDKISAYRQDYKTIISPTEKILTLLKIREIENEHIVLFNNKTTFGDILFDSLLCVKTHRLKLMGIGIDGWNGSFFAPGYILEDDGATPNYDKLAEDFKYMYDTDDVRSFGLLGEYAKKTIGFKELPYMSLLFLDDRNIFDFYKGMIQEKGTRLSFNKLNRSDYIMTNKENKMDLQENWAFKMGEFGHTLNNSTMEFKVLPSEITHNPQIFKFSTDKTISTTESINYNWNNENWLKKKKNQMNNVFTYNDKNKLLPIGGISQIDDVDFIVADISELETIENKLNVGNIIWIVNANGRDWDIVKKLENKYISLKFNTIGELNSFDSTLLDDNDLVYVKRINLSKSFDLINDDKNLMKSSEVIIDKNAWVIFKYIKSSNNVVSAPNGIATKYGYNTLLYHKDIVIDLPNGIENNNKIFERYTTIQDKSIDILETTNYVAIDNNGDIIQVQNYFEQNDEPQALKQNDIWFNPNENKSYIYNNRWIEQKVKIISSVKAENNGDNINLISYRFNYPYILERIENKSININLIKSCYLVDNETDETMAEVQLFDPLQCIIPNNVLKEVNYITAQDPVNYNDDNNWSDLKVGYLWWDLSKVKYINYYQGDNLYRRNNWGKQLPGSEIAIMEWTKSTILPEELQIQEKKKYITKNIYNSATSSYDTYYFYWSKNPIEIPENDFRKNSAFTISQVINSPQDMGIIWMSPISINEYNGIESSFILGNFDNVSSGREFVIQINYKSNDENDNFEEWILVKSNTNDVIPNNLWSKMKASLTGYDELGQVVPNPELNDKEKIGISIRPRQTMFKNLISARHNFVDVINDIFSSRDILSFVDVDTSEWKNVFKEVEKTSYDVSYVCSSHFEMNNINDKELIGKYIQVLNDEEFENIWTVWFMKDIGNYELVDYKTFDIEKYYNYADFYKDNTTMLSIPKYVISSERELINYVNKLSNGDIIKTYNNEGNWILKEYNNGVFHTVGLQNGVIYLNSNLYDFMENDEILKDNENRIIFIDNMTKFEYLMNEVSIIIPKILSYFEK